MVTNCITAILAVHFSTPVFLPAHRVTTQTYKLTSCLVNLWWTWSVNFKTETATEPFVSTSPLPLDNHSRWVLQDLQLFTCVSYFLEICLPCLKGMYSVEACSCFNCSRTSSVTLFPYLHLHCLNIAISLEKFVLHRNNVQVLGCVLNAMANAQKPYLVFRGNGRVHLNRRGRQFSRLLAAEVAAHQRQ